MILPHTPHGLLQADSEFGRCNSPQIITGVENLLDAESNISIRDAINGQNTRRMQECDTNVPIISLSNVVKLPTGQWMRLERRSELLHPLRGPAMTKEIWRT